MTLAQKQKYRKMEQAESPEINPCTYGHFIFTKEGRIYNREKTASSISGTISCPGKTGHLHVKERN